MISWKFNTKSKQPIGLDIGDDSIKMVQLAKADDILKVQAAEKISISPDIANDPQLKRDYIIDSIKKIMAKKTFSGKEVVSCIPNKQLKVTSLRFSQDESDQIEKVLIKNAANRLQLDPHRDAIDYMHAGNVKHGDETKNEFIIFAADDNTIRQHIDLLETAGLTPASIDVAPCALFRTFERFLRRYEDRDRTTVLMDIGKTFTTVVFGKGNDICFVKQIPLGGEKFDLEIAQRLQISAKEANTLRKKLQKEIKTKNSAAFGQVEHRNITESSLDSSTRQAMIDAVTKTAEDLAKEISLCFRYYTVTFRGKRVEKAILAGGEAYENILLNILKRHLTVDIELAEPLKGFDMNNVRFDSDRRKLLSEWTVAVGLSLKGIKNKVNEAVYYERN